MKKKLLSACLVFLILITQNFSLVYAEEVVSDQRNVDFSVILQRGDGSQETLQEIQKNVVEVTGEEGETLKIELQPSVEQGQYEYQFSIIRNGEKEILKGPGSEDFFDIVEDEAGQYVYSIAVFQENQQIGEKTLYVNIEPQKGEGDNQPTEDVTSSTEEGSENASDISGTEESTGDQDVELQGTLESNVGEYAYVGSPIVLTATVFQGNGDYQYQFEEEYQSERRVVQEFSESTVYNGVVQEAGNHIYYVTIKDAKGKLLELSCVIDVKERVAKSVDEKERAVFFGDSLTARNDWAAMYPEFEVKNAGVGSNTTKNMLGRVNEIIEWQPDLVFIMGGINDLAQGSDSSQIVANIKEIITQIQSELPSVKIYLQSVLPTDEKLVKNSKVVELNNDLESLGGSTGVQFVNLYPYFYGADQIKTELYDGGVHLSAAGYSVWKNGLDVALNGGELIDSELSGRLTNSATANEYVMRTMTLTAEVTSGNGGYTYQFEEVYNGNRKVVQETSEKNTYTFTTKEVGIHTYYVTIKDAKGKSLTLSYQMKVVMNPGLVLKGTLKSSASSPQYEKRSVTLTAEMSSGYGEYEYQFTEVYNGKSEVVQKYSDKCSYSFETEGVGLHTYYVDVKDGIGQTLRLSYVLDVREYPTQTLAGTLTNSATANEYVMRTMTLTAEVTSGNGGYTYQFEEVYDGNRKVVQEASEKNTYTFTTKEVGIHTYYVTIKDAKGKSLTLSYQMKVVMNPGLVLKGTLKSSASSPQYEKRSVTLTAEMSSGYGEYEYQFTEVYNGKSEVVQKYSDKCSYSFETEGVGLHTYYVDVKDGIGQTLRLSYVLDVREYPTQTLAGTLTNSATANEYVMRTMTLTAEVTSGNGGYTYQFEEVYDGNRKVVQEASEKNTYTFTTKEVGIHTYYVTIKDAKGKSLTLSYQMKVVMNPGLVLKGTLKSSASSPQYEKRSVTLTAEMSSGYGEYEYQFTEVYNGKSEVVQKYSDKCSYSFETEGVGLHTYYVDVKDGIGQTLRLSYVLDVREYPTQTLAGTLTNSATANEYVMRTMTLTAEVTSGNGGYTYQFEEVYDGNRKVVQEASEKNTYTFTTKEVGIHTYYVTIKDAKGKSLTLSYQMKVVMNPGLVLKGTLKSSASSPQYEKRSVTLTAEMSSGYGEYEYQFTEVYNGKSEVVQKYSDKCSYSFETEGVGLHTYYVDVKDGIGQTLRLSYVLDVREYPTQTLAGTLTNSATANEYVMRTMTLTAEVTSGNGGYTYQFEEVYNGNRKVVQETSEKNTYTFTTKEVGIHTYYVTVKDAKGKSLTLSYRMNVVPHPSSILQGTLENSASSNEYVDRSMILTATASSGYGDYKYQFEELYNGERTIVQEYTEENTYSFTTEKVGTHIYYVTIRDTANQTVTLSYTMTVVKHPSVQITGTLTSNKTNNEYSSRDIVLTATLTSEGYGECEYEFVRIYKGASKVVQQYSEENTYSFRTGLPGSYIYQVNVRDRSNTVVSFTYAMTVVANGTFDQGIDVSAWQGTINWSQVKNSGVSFAMLRILSGTMAGLQVDSEFYNNAKGASANDISIGVYRYGYAVTVSDAKEEAIRTIQALKIAEGMGVKITYPVAYDVEDEATQGQLSKSQLANIINAYKSVIEDYGYKFMIYSNPNWLTNKIDMSSFAGDDIWLARWFYDGTPYHDHGYMGPGNVTIWQYSSTGSVPGISGNVDMNVGYVRY